TLDAQRLVPPPLRHVVAAVLGPAEALSGLAAAAAFVVRPVVPLAGCLVVAGWFLAFALFAAVLRARRPAAPCGCFGADTAVSAATVGRAAAVAVAALGAAAVGPVPLAGPAHLVVWLVAVVAAAGAWLLPMLWAAPPPKPRRPPRA
ncbi:MAG TPA: MauE/DoxX family redox-associated membrane protein, partial [Pilimelia sp.]|nr:MauE/DoxX family redox-associated membrane protein [Pilimelia sp.]